MKKICISLSLALSLGACGPKKKSSAKQPIGRTAAVALKTDTGAVNDKSGFCEKTYPASGQGARAFNWPTLRPLPGEKSAQTGKLTGRWTWINLWATWCEPCMDEMGLLQRWTTSLESEGQPIQLELLSIDAPKDASKLQAVLDRGLPGPVRWLANPELFDAFLEHLGVGRGAASPIHALVDPKGQLRCVRVGAISALDFAAVKGIFQGG